VEARAAVVGVIKARLHRKETITSALVSDGVHFLL
jgi:hypothetical protein